MSGPLPQPPSSLAQGRWDRQALALVGPNARFTRPEQREGSREPRISPLDTIAGTTNYPILQHESLPERRKTALVKFLQYSADLIYCPHLALRALLGDPRRVGFGFLGHLILAAVYFIGISVALAMNAAHLPQLLVLNIPVEQYYSYERFFILPVGLSATILTSGVIRLVARWWNGQGHFEDLFALLGFSLIVVAVVIGLPDLVMGMLVGIGIMAPLGWEFIGPHVWLGSLWYLVLTILTVKEVERLSWRKSIVLALMGFIVNGVVQFVFIR